MLYFYDGQIRRYLLQVIRVFSNFVVKYGDGTLAQIPVMYGDADRQAASILRQNSENKINSIPKMAVYITGLDIDRDRLGDATHISKVHIRERGVQFNPVTGRDEYINAEGKNYTIERLMPSPYKLTFKLDIWSSSAEQKLQIIEQILVLFNPSLELQTSDNYVDWASLSVLNIASINWSSRTVPVGVDSPIDIATITLDTPIWISPPAKVKKLGVITNIISSVATGISPAGNGYIHGMGVEGLGGIDDVVNKPNVDITNDLMAVTSTSIMGGFGVLVYAGQAQILNPGESISADNHEIDIGVKYGASVDWNSFLKAFPGPYAPGASKIYLMQSSGLEVWGTIVISELDPTILSVNWNPDTYPSNTLIETNNRPASPGTFDAIIDPTKKGPGSGLDAPEVGTRYLIIEGIGATTDLGYKLTNQDGPDAWKSTSGEDFYAMENDIIEWDGSKWNVIFEAAQNDDQIIYQTNIYTGVQYKWNGVSWVKSFEGEYKAGEWRLVL